MRRGVLLIALLCVAAVVGASFVAHAVLEGLVAPGGLSRAHAKLDRQCVACHVPFLKVAQNAACVSCHKDVGRDVRQRTGFHGRHPDVRGHPCSSCHAEHRGRSAQLVSFDPKAFDHRLTDFELHGAHAQVACFSCHRVGTPFTSAPHTCVSCHAKADVHQGRFGQDCASCHDEVSWKRFHAFDHRITGYPLLGLHRTATCVGCHVGGKLQGLPQTCVACHRADDVHRGSRGPDCTSCHTPSGWKLPKFDHLKETGFALDGVHAGVACIGCHGATFNLRKPATTCNGCHAKDDVHRGANGVDCATCHVSAAWRTIRFDHDRLTRFALAGAHAAVACKGCHAGPLRTVKPPTTCIGCHAKDDPHHGRLGTACATCHTAASWKTGVRFDHALTRFPLTGKHAGLACDGCHADKGFAAKGLTCAACHADSFHRGRLGASPDCATCHVTSGWKLWRFDHARQAGFPLDGAHANLECHGCHARPAARANLDAGCYACHRADDVHKGQFGQRCGDCHSTRSFKGGRVAPERPARAAQSAIVSPPPAQTCPNDLNHPAWLACRGGALWPPGGFKGARR